MSDVLDLSIDKTSLDQEWVEQPALYFKWAKAAADANSDLDRAKSRLELVEAELASSIRGNPSDYGMDKATDKSVDAAVPLQPEYQSAVRKVNEAKHSLAVANAAVNALEHRKRALSLLVELWIREYYTADSSPKPRTELADGFDKAAVRGRGKRRMELAERDRDTDD